MRRYNFIKISRMRGFGLGITLVCGGNFFRVHSLISVDLFFQSLNFLYSRRSASYFTGSFP